MNSQFALFAILGFCLGSAPAEVGSKAEDEVAAVRQNADIWRRDHRIIDLHEHIDCTPEHLLHAVQIMDRVGSGSHEAFLAWSPTATTTAHTAAKFGGLEFEE